MMCWQSQHHQQQQCLICQTTNSTTTVVNISHIWIYQSIHHLC
jgi:hypothetical protein